MNLLNRTDNSAKTYTFCNTLVYKFLTGYPRVKRDAITEELGYQDNLIVKDEQFHLRVIEEPNSIKEEIPTEICRLNILFTENMEPYRTHKASTLNGAHTSLVPVGYLYGIDKVKESLKDKIIGGFLKNTIFYEIRPTLDLPLEELVQFVNDAKSIVKKTLFDTDFWGEDLKLYKTLENVVAKNLGGILSKGMKTALKELSN